MIKNKFDTFLIYHSINQEWVFKLSHALAKEGIKVWLEDDKLRPGDQLINAIEESFQEFENIIIVFSVEAMKSGWLIEEYDRIVSLTIKHDFHPRIIPILLFNVELPHFIKTRQWIDFRDETKFEEGVQKLKEIIYGLQTVAGAGTGRVLAPKIPDQFDISSYVQNELKKFKVGILLFNVPSVMRVGISERIEVRISQKDVQDIANNLKGRGIPEIEKIKVGTFMNVRLSGENFSIISLNKNEKQLISKDHFNEWCWNVTPMKSGKQVLHLLVSIRIKLPNGDERIDHPVLDKEVQVRVNAIYSVKKVIIKYWKWIATTIIIPIIGWLIKEYLLK